MATTGPLHFNCQVLVTVVTVVTWARLRRDTITITLLDKKMQKLFSILALSTKLCKIDIADIKTHLNTTFRLVHFAGKVLNFRQEKANSGC